MSYPLVSVIIATYKREELLCQTIQNLLEQKYPDFEILVIDQTIEHQDETTKYIEKLSAQKKIVYLKTAPPNLPRARNIGIQMSKGEILIFVDDDVKIEPDFIENHVKNYSQKNNPEIGGVAGKVISDPAVNFPDAYKCKDQIKDWWFLTFSFEKHAPIATAIGCNMSFKKSVLEKVGIFDENFIEDSNKEETDLCFRLRKAGFQIIFDPDSKLIHLTHPQGGTRGFKKDLTLSPNFYRNQIYFFLKNVPPIQLPKYLILTYRYFVSREKEQILKSPAVFLRFLKRNIQFFRGLFRGCIIYFLKRKSLT